MQKTTTSKPADSLFGTILHSNLTILEVAEPHILAELKADRRLAPMIVAQVSDRVAVIAPGRAEAFIKQLLKAGHTPKVIEK